MRLTPEQVAEEKKYLSELKERVWFGEHGLTSAEQDLFDTIEAQQQEINLLNMEIAELRESNQALKDYAENADADKDEQAGTIMRMENMLYQAKDVLQMGVDYLNHDKPFDPLGSMKIAIKAIDALLGGKEDA